MSVSLVVHAGAVPGELVIQSTDALSPGVVVLPTTTSAHRYAVEAIAGGKFLLMRVGLLPWPQAPTREGLFTFETEASARAALAALEEALMAIDVETPPAPRLLPPKPVVLLCLMAAALIAGVVIGQLLN